MNTHLFKMVCMMVLFLPAYTSQTTTPSSPPQTASPIPPAAATSSEISLIENAPQSGAMTTRDKVGLILGNLLILSLYSFPMSYGENWAISDPKKDKKRPKTELPAGIESTGKPTQTISKESPTSIAQRKTMYKRLSDWALELPRVPAGLAAGGCLMVVVVVAGAVAFALHYLFSGQPEKVSQILPRFAYWFPFALLGMVTDMPFTFKTFDWEDRRIRVLLRLIVWWMPRIVIVAFMLDLPIVRDLDPATTALAVLAIDGVLAAFFLWLHMSRKQIGMRDVQQDYDT